MKRYLLDTAVLAAFLHGRKNVVAPITPLIAKHEAATSILAYAEVTEYLKGPNKSAYTRCIILFYPQHK